MLITAVVIYLLVTIAIGLLAARRVHNAKDYMVAGRSLPLYMNVATVITVAVGVVAWAGFAMWAHRAWIGVPPF